MRLELFQSDTTLYLSLLSSFSSAIEVRAHTATMGTEARQSLTCLRHHPPATAAVELRVWPRQQVSILTITTTKRSTTANKRRQAQVVAAVLT